jgi:hypothetical protein
MRLRAIRSHFVAGRIVAPGEVYEIADAVARGLIETGKSERAPAPKPEPIKTDSIETAAPQPTKQKPKLEVSK